MYYRVPQIRRAGQRITSSQAEDQTSYDYAGRSSDLIEFGGDGNVDHSPLDFELCKGISCPLD
jgi:hypothetical protein